jgi:spoIIIJ-associated protein
VTAEPAAESAKTEYKSSLRNQAKPQRRQKTPKSAAADAVPGAEAIIPAPMGLTDFTREENASSFGSESSSGGRMSNDIRKKPRHPKQAIQPEQIAENIKEAKEYKEVRPEIEEAVLPALDANEEITEILSELPVSEIAESAETEASEAPAVEEDRLKVGVTEAEMQYALDFTNTLLKNMAIGATASRVECPEGEEYVIEGDANVYPKINIDGDGTGILIGHHGETLDAVQYLVNLAALRQSKQKGGDYVKIVVDIENYRAKREETLRSLARRMAARAVKYKRNVFLEPMNAYERRIIHSELHSFENVSTHSVGADKNRKIIITYEGPDKAPQQPRREKEERSEKRENKQESRNGGSAGSGNRRNENRRPKKIQKMPIEKLPDFLASGTVEENDRFVEIED